MGEYIVAVTGASGALYAKNMLRAMHDLGQDIHLTVTEPGRQVLAAELDWELPALGAIEFFEALKGYLKWHEKSRLEYYDYREIGARIASGSVRTDGMIIVPCTVSTLSGIATGTSKNLVERAADVMLKERRPLVLILRETPFNQVHLKNMLELARMGVHIVPAAPAFYHRPETIDDLINFIVGKTLDLLGIENSLFTRWEGN